MYVWNWNVIFDNLDIFFQGALTTLWLTLLVIIIGTILGTILGLLRRSRDPIISYAVKIFIDLFRALPILVLLIWIFYVTPTLVSWQVSPFIAALIALSLNLTAFVAETVRAGIDSVPKHQFESGVVLGLSPVGVMLRLILPQAIRNMLPNLMGLYINQLKNSSLASVIAVNEVLHQANILISNTFRPLEIYTGVAITYLILILPFSALARHVEKRIARKQK